MYKIALDLDNCILDSVSTIINLHNKLNKDKQYNYNTNDKFGWKFEPLIKTDEELAELFKLFDHNQFYNNPIVFDNAIEVINTLSMQNSVCIISKHMESRKPLTIKWITETFPTVDIMFVDSFSDKGKLLKDFDILLDDRLDAIESAQGIVKYPIVYGDYLWNSEWTGFRVNNWLEFKQFVDNISQQ